MGGACSKDGRDEKCIQTQREKHIWEDIRIDLRVIGGYRVERCGMDASDSE